MEDKYMYITNVKDLQSATPVKHADRKIIAGDNSMFCIYKFEPGADFPTHSHPAEQITYIVKGPWYLKVGEKEELVKVDTGTIAVFEPNCIHGGKSAGNEAICIDVWAPVREDLLKEAKIVRFGKEVE
jgi:quercetin dioxygenase-like cupin family protein